MNKKRREQWCTTRGSVPKTSWTSIDESDIDELRDEKKQPGNGTTESVNKQPGTGTP